MKNYTPCNSDELRRRAEERLNEKQTPDIGSKHKTGTAETVRALHELRVHQIELEMQNDELRTAQAQIEAGRDRYFDLYDLAPVGYCTVGEKGLILEANLTAAKLLGVARNALVKQPVSRFILKEDQDIYYLYRKQLFATGEPQECELRLVKPDGTTLWARMAATIAQAEDGGSLCRIVLSDITDHKRAEREVQEKNEELKKINNELIAAKEKAEGSDLLKSAFLANMSHEIRTPMNGILGFADLLKKTDLSGDQQQEYINIIEQSGMRMLNIINNIVDISKIEAGLMEIDIDKSDINGQIEYIYTFFKPEADAKSLTLSFKNSLPTGEAIIKTDREKVFAILTNLIKNAIKYTTEGYIEFGYNLKTDREPTELEFYVKDSGLGIPADKQDAVFERFIQADISGKMGRQGAGLGLAITRAYVEMLGGKIWLESEEGKGSTFYFTLPYNVDVKPVIEAVDGQPALLEKNDAANLKIVIAEDDGISAMLIDKYIEIFAKEILKVKTGLDAVKACHDNPDADLILMDIEMPEMGGCEAARQIREFNKKVVIIAQTALGLSQDREKSIESGCNDYIAKPIDKDKLHALIRKYFEK